MKSEKIVTRHDKEEGEEKVDATHSKEPDRRESELRS